jgi:hypothetical protein
MIAPASSMTLGSDVITLTSGIRGPNDSRSAARAGPTDLSEDIARVEFARMLKERSIGEIDPSGGAWAKGPRDGGSEPESRNGIWKRPILHYHVRGPTRPPIKRPLSTMTPSQVTSGAVESADPYRLDVVAHFDRGARQSSPYRARPAATAESLQVLLARAAVAQSRWEPT